MTLVGITRPKNSFLWLGSCHLPHPPHSSLCSPFVAEMGRAGLTSECMVSIMWANNMEKDVTTPLEMDDPKKGSF